MKPAKAAVKKPRGDRGESPSLMEPLLLAQASPHRPALTDLALTVAEKSSAFRYSLPPGIVAALADLVRAMNCYYSNLIEGHNTHPVDIERALAGNYSTDAKKRDLQVEAAAHISVQRWIDEGGLSARALAVSSMREVHRRFCSQLPEDMLWVEDDETHRRSKVVPGTFREMDVRVGRHVPISALSIPRFLERFEEVYGPLGRTETILAAAAAHHRFLWIHPFLDGNGRVARLLSHATFLQTLDTAALWSVARGLARRVDEYRGHLAACDEPRRGDLDGRGSRSEAALAEFTEFFLGACVDQIVFMRQLMQPEELRPRVLAWAAEETAAKRLPARARDLMQALLYNGEISRGDVQAIVSGSERTARRVVAALADRGVIKAESSRAPLKLALPATLAERFLPGLFPSQPAR